MTRAGVARHGFLKEQVLSDSEGSGNGTQRLTHRTCSGALLLPVSAPKQKDQKPPDPIGFNTIRKLPKFPIYSVLTFQELDGPFNPIQ